MPRLSAATEHALSIIAHAQIVMGMAKNIAGFSDFYEFWLKEQATKDREIVDAFTKLSIQARKDFSAMLANDLKGING